MADSAHVLCSNTNDPLYDFTKLVQVIAQMAVHGKRRVMIYSNRIVRGTSLGTISLFFLFMLLLVLNMEHLNIKLGEPLSLRKFPLRNSDCHPLCLSAV
jgi:hypothetical protein